MRGGATPGPVGTLCRWLGAIMALLGGARAVATAAEPVTVDVEFALTRAAFSGVNPNDAVVAYGVFLGNLGKENGHRLRPKARVFDSTAQFEEATLAGQLHVAVMDTWQYLEIEKRTNLRPVAVPTFGGKAGRRMVVVARQDSGFRTLADLRQEKLVWLEAVRNDVSRHWLLTQLPDEPEESAREFLDSIEVVTKPSSAVLPVFFGKKAAAITDEAGFDLMKELNPQVGKVLHVIASSEPLVDIVICLSDRNWHSPAVRDDVERSLVSLNEYPAGRQILTLFRISGMVPFAPAQIDAVRKLQEKTVTAGSTAAMEAPASR